MSVLITYLGLAVGGGEASDDDTADEDKLAIELTAYPPLEELLLEVDTPELSSTY